MSEGKSGGGLKALVLVVFAAGAGIAATGGLAVLGWTLTGFTTSEMDPPGLEGQVVKGREDSGAELTPAPENMLGPIQQALGGLAVAVEGASEKKNIGVLSVVASAPIEADEDVYQQYMARKDVLVLVEYYADW